MTEEKLSSSELADQLDRQLAELRRLVAGCPGGRWQATTSEGWTIPASAQHALMHAMLVQWAAGIAKGEETVFTTMTRERLDGINAENASKYVSRSKEKVLAAIDAARPAAVGTLRSLSDADIEKSQQATFFGGEPATGRRVIEGLLLGELGQHIANLRAAIEG